MRVSWCIVEKIIEKIKYFILWFFIILIMIMIMNFYMYMSIIIINMY